LQSAIIDRNGLYFDRVRSTFYQKTSTMSKESSLLENDDLPKMHIKMRGLSTPTPIGTSPPPFRRACAGWRQFDN
jgi:hypothetical protein